MQLDKDTILFIAGGTLTTLKYTICSVALGLIIAVLLSYCSFSKIKTLNYFNKFYVSIFRGTPLLIQLSIVFFGIPSIIGIKISPFIAGVTAFSLNSAAYVSEVLRAGINSIDKGQFEAAKTLGINHNLMMRQIIIPQALKNILPALINELTNMLKESALVSMIGEADLMRRAQLVSAEKYTYFMPYIIAACCYYILVNSLGLIGNILEKRLKNDYH
jgi:polar amino acid transport system permease protein